MDTGHGAAELARGKLRAKIGQLTEALTAGSTITTVHGPIPAGPDSISPASTSTASTGGSTS
jgi:hypothetical protein